jgi:hypothetical protein
MTIGDWVVLLVAVASIVGAVFGVVLHYRDHGPDLDPDDFRAGGDGGGGGL